MAAMKLLRSCPAIRAALVAFILLGVQSESQARPRIGMLLKNNGVVWAKTAEGITEAAAALDIEVVLKSCPPGAPPTVQATLLGALAKEQLDALILAPIEPARLEPTLRALVEKGVKLIVIDTQVAAGLSKIFITNDQEKMAEAAAQRVLEFVKDGDEVAMLRFQQTDQVLLDRERKILNTLKAALPALKLRADIYSGSGLSTSLEQAHALLVKYPNAKTIVTTSFGATKAMVRAIRAKELIGKVHVIGFGIYLPEEMAKAIEDGVLDVWISQKPKDLGTKAFEVAMASLQGKEVPETNYVGFEVVTKDNLASPNVQVLIKEAVIMDAIPTLTPTPLP